jgi:hypothetical protein
VYRANFLDRARQKAKEVVTKKTVVNFVKDKGEKIQATLSLALDFVAKRSNANSKSFPHMSLGLR